MEFVMSPEEYAQCVQSKFDPGPVSDFWEDITAWMIGED